MQNATNRKKQIMEIDQNDIKTIRRLYSDKPSVNELANRIESLTFYVGDVGDIESLIFYVGDTALYLPTGEKFFIKRSSEEVFKYYGENALLNFVVDRRVRRCRMLLTEKTKNE